MTPSGLAYAQPYPGATTCILLGPPAAGADFSDFAGVLWFVDATGAAGAPPSAPAWQAVPLERLDTDRLQAVVERFVLGDPRHLPSVFVAEASLHEHAEAYQVVLTTVCAQLERLHQSRLSRQRHGFVRQRHVLQNLPAYVRRRLPPSWRGALRGRTAFVCGAGASLAASAPALAAQEGKRVIIAVDAALRRLADRRVAADLAVSVDVARGPAECLPAELFPAHTVLSAESPPAWQEALPPATVWFAASRQITTAWLEDAGVTWPDLAALEHAESTALELARYLGCAPIYLFGFDLALDTREAVLRYAEGSRAPMFAAAESEAVGRVPEIPGNYGRVVPTDVLDEWRIVDARLASWPAGLVYNVTDRGAALRNTTLLHPDNFALPEPGSRSPLRMRLPEPEPVDAAVLEAAFGQVRETARRASAGLAGLRAALARGGPPALASALRPLFADQAIGRVLGAFSLKIMPHLMPPLEGDAAFWGALVEEYAELLALAQAVR